jgi:hypothetical protein
MRSQRLKSASVKVTTSNDFGALGLELASLIPACESRIRAGDLLDAGLENAWAFPFVISGDRCRLTPEGDHEPARIRLSQADACQLSPRQKLNLDRHNIVRPRRAKGLLAQHGELIAHARCFLEFEILGVLKHLFFQLLDAFADVAFAHVFDMGAL